jgi:hypothetical protein
MNQSLRIAIIICVLISSMTLIDCVVEYSYSTRNYYELTPSTIHEDIEYLRFHSTDKIRLSRSRYSNNTFLLPWNDSVNVLDYENILDISDMIFCQRTSKNVQVSYNGVYMQEYMCYVQNNKYNITRLYTNFHCSYYEFEDCHIYITSFQKNNRSIDVNIIHLFSMTVFSIIFATLLYFVFCCYNIINL